MTETTTITSVEIEAVAAKIDADEPLDRYDKVVLRGLFLLAGEAASQVIEDDEVEGFDFAPGAPNVGFGLSLNFDPPLDDADQVHGHFSTGQSLSRHCCQGTHYKKTSL